jgi:hypothetical protein
MEGQRVDVTVQPQADDLAHVHQVVTGPNALPDPAFQLGGGTVDQRDVTDAGAMRHPVEGVGTAGSVGTGEEAPSVS